jgi:hypothetical protein
MTRCVHNVFEVKKAVQMSNYLIDLLPAAGFIAYLAFALVGVGLNILVARVVIPKRPPTIKWD